MKTNSEFEENYRFLFYLFLDQNMYSLKDSLDKGRVLEKEQILRQINHIKYLFMHQALRD